MGAGADFGDGKGCTGTVTVLDADMRTNPVASGQAPFTDNPYRPEGNLASLYGEDAHGQWTLKVTNSGRRAHLQCLTLDIARAVPETLAGHSGGVTATVTYTERNFFYDKLRLKIVRSGRTALDVPIQRAGCKDCTAASGRPWSGCVTSTAASPRCSSTCTRRARIAARSR